MTKKSVIVPLRFDLETFKPSAFTPFLRRFTNERARDLTDTKALYNRVRALHYASPYCGEEADFDIGGSVYGAACGALDEHLRRIFGRTIHAILMLERPIFEFPEIDFSRAQLTLKEHTDLRNFLRAKEYFHAHERKVVGLLTNCLSMIFSHIADMLPMSAEQSPFTIPLIHTIPEPKKLVGQLYGTLYRQEYIDTGLFVEVTRAMHLNMCRVSGIVDPHDPKKPFKLPADYDGPLHDMVGAYLAGTPFYDFFMAPVPLRFTHEERFSHMHVVGGSGAGKTQLLQNLILQDLHSEDPPALVVVDSQGDLINKLSHLALFDPDTGPLADRLVLISPKDIKNPPALNIFDINRERLGEYDEATKEQVVAGVIQTFDYLFTGLLGADLTAKQSVFFRFVARLMLSLPETMGRSATILDMINLMDDPTPYRQAIQSLPPIQRNFFERDFAGKTFIQTKEQIRYRLNAILENPTLARLFTAPKTRIDIFDILNNGGIILVDTAKDFLKSSSSHFGRIFISLVLQAVLERAAIAEHHRTPTFLIVDEAATYFDSNIDDFLTEARKYKCGCVFAHQFLDQATSQLRSSLAANTAIKFAGSVSMSDARAIAPDMRTTPDFIVSQPKLHFAAHVRHTTPGAVSIPIWVGLLEAQPCMDEVAYGELRRLNSARVSLPKAITYKAADPRPSTEEPSPLPPKPTVRQAGPSADEKSPPPSRHSDDPSAASDEW